jgi:hypothetical protein
VCFLTLVRELKLCLCGDSDLDSMHQVQSCVVQIISRRNYVSAGRKFYLLHWLTRSGALSTPPRQPPARFIYKFSCLAARCNNSLAEWKALRHIHAAHYLLELDCALLLFITIKLLLPPAHNAERKFWNSPRGLLEIWKCRRAWHSRGFPWAQHFIKILS